MNNGFFLSKATLWKKKKSVRKNKWRKLKEIQEVLHIESLSEVLFSPFLTLFKRFGSLLMKKVLGSKINAHEFLNVLIKWFEFCGYFFWFSLVEKFLKLI